MLGRTKCILLYFFLCVAGVVVAIAPSISAQGHEEQFAWAQQMSGRWHPALSQWPWGICLDLGGASCAVHFLLQVACQIRAANTQLLKNTSCCKEATVTSANFGSSRACLTCLPSRSSLSSGGLKCIQILSGLLYLLWINLLFSFPLPHPFT